MWRTLLLITAIPAAMACLLAATAWWWYPGELACHWGAQAALGVIPGLIAMRNRNRWSGVLLACMLLGSVPATIGAWQPRAALPTVGAPTMRVACANLFIYNQPEMRAQAVASAFATNADIVVLAEAISSNDKPLVDAAAHWPYQVWAPQINRKWHDCVAIASKWPIIFHAIGARDTQPFIAATIDVQGRHLHVIAVHTQSLKFTREWHWRDQQLADIAATVQRLIDTDPAPVLVMGDHNVSPASPSWQRFVATAQLNSPPGIASATWPNWLGPLGIGIDHITSRGLTMSPTTTFAIPGSDHLGLTCTVGWPIGAAN